MLTLTGLVRGVVRIGGGTMRKTGEIIAVREMLQVECTDNRGLVVLHNLAVPDPSAWLSKVGQVCPIPVRAWAQGVPVNLAYEDQK